MIAGTYEEGRAEGLALGFLAALEAIVQTNRFDVTKSTLEGVVGYVETNLSYGQWLVLKAIWANAGSGVPA